MDETLFGELKRYVDWVPADEQALRALHGVASPHFARIADVFYDRILTHQGARQSLTGGETQVGHLRLTLRAWLDRLLSGPWDEEYFEARCRIGRYHVQIALPQHYMFGAMNVIRRELNALVDARWLKEPAALGATRGALGKILDLELAIMLHTYREDLLAQQARAERLSTFGQLAGSIGHDLRNPLGVIETSLFILKGRLGEDERVKKHVERIGEQLTIANGIIGNLLDMIRNRPLVRAQVPLEPVARGAADSVKHPPEVEVRLAGFDDLPDAMGDALQLRQVFMNLVDNAVQAAAPEGRVLVEGRAMGDGLVEVAVEDSGPGVDEQVRRRLFEPLITSREKGNGLGLALVKRIVERHGGAITYAPRPGAGARFVVTLPTR